MNPLEAQLWADQQRLKTPVPHWQEIFPPVSDAELRRAEQELQQLLRAEL